LTPLLLKLPYAKSTAENPHPWRNPGLKGTQADTKAHPDRRHFLKIQYEDGIKI
jgi:hypothetical protein